MTHYARHYAVMFFEPAWSDHARHTVRQMEAETSWVWVGLLAMTQAEVARIRADSAIAKAREGSK